MACDDLVRWRLSLQTAAAGTPSTPIDYGKTLPLLIHYVLPLQRESTALYPAIWGGSGCEESSRNLLNDDRVGRHTAEVIILVLVQVKGEGKYSSISTPRLSA